MGKVRYQRKKLHLESKKSPQTLSPTEKHISELGPSLELPIQPQNNVFEGLNIDITSIKKSLTNDDVRSVKSYKSVKSESGKVLSKKDRIKLRRELLLKKFEIIQQQKQLKKKKTAVVGDLNPLRDALPSLESLLSSRGKVSYKQDEPKKKKGIEKLRKIKKNQLQGIKMFQQILKNKHYLKDPQMAISQQVKAVLEQEKSREIKS